MQAARADGHVTVNDASFYVRAGEIYGVAGVGGNGQTELVEALTGVRAPLVRIDRDRRRRRRHRRLARALCATSASPAFRPIGSAMASPAACSVVDNFCVGHIGEGAYGSWLRTNRRPCARATADAVGAFDVQGVRSLRQRAALLSGGNAQKLIIAREFSRDPKVIVAHSPSRGLDVRACAAVHERLLKARAARRRHPVDQRRPRRECSISPIASAS